ncbi:MAG TPA: DUF3078 domain-containing protein [Cyclobacteriaceae bacterium]|nr:DUF3078 domain-containing protein [Cyclobacteriaceae bacterium]
MKNTPFTYCSRAIIVLLLAAIGVAPSHGQVVKVDSTSNWKKAFRIGININQAAFSSNWKAGGVNSFGFTGLLNYKANYKKDKTSWDNEIDLLYGMVNNQGQGYRKTLDRIFLDTKYGHALSDKWDMFLAANVISQFAAGYKYVKDVNGVEQPLLLSESLSPTFLTATYGFEYHPASYFKLRLSPMAPRITFLTNNDGRYVNVDPISPYGVTVGENVRYEWYAFQALAEFNKDIATNVNLKARYMLFANYKTLEWKQVDHRLDINIVAKINKYMNVSFGGIMVYDYDQDASAQYSQAFSLGILYSFQNFADKK